MVTPDSTTAIPDQGDEAVTERVPCDHLTEPFHSRGYCVNCDMLAELHTPEGWERYYTQQAGGCAAVAQNAEVRAAEMRQAQQANIARAMTPPTYTPQCRRGFWPTNGGTTGDSTTCARCGREKGDPVHNGQGTAPFFPSDSGRNASGEGA